MIDLSVSVGGEFVTRVKADGLIVAQPDRLDRLQPRGRRADRAADVDALVLTPIAPHTLTNRPIVHSGAIARQRAAGGRIEPRRSVRDLRRPGGFAFRHGDEVSVTRAERTLRLIRASTRSYFEVLRQKLKWGER